MRTEPIVPLIENRAATHPMMMRMHRRVCGVIHPRSLVERSGDHRNSWRSSVERPRPFLTFVSVHTSTSATKEFPINRRSNRSILLDEVIDRERRAAESEDPVRGVRFLHLVDDGH